MSYTSPEWYFLWSPVLWVTTPGGATRFGNTFFYQAAVGRNICSKPDGFIITPMIEFFGVYENPDKIDGSRDPNSGSNTAYVGPTLWTSTKRFWGQVGVLYAAAQTQRGNQTKNQYIVALDVGWKFNT